MPVVNAAWLLEARAFREFDVRGLVDQHGKELDSTKRTPEWLVARLIVQEEVAVKQR